MVEHARGLYDKKEAFSSYKLQHALSPYYKVALTTLGSSIYSLTETDEFEIAEKIKRKFVRQKRDKDAAVFSELHRILQGQKLLRNRWAILYLLHRLSGESTSKQKGGTSSTFFHSLSSHLVSTPFVSQHSGQLTTDGSAKIHSVTGSSTASSGISSIRSSFHSNDPSPVPQSVPPSYLKTPAGAQLLRGGQVLPSTGERVLHLLGRNQTDTTLMLRSDRTISTTSTSYRMSRKPGSSDELSEAVILRELVYVFRGIEGKYIKYDVTKEGYRIDAKAGIPRALRKAVAKLAECGWMYNQIWKYADSRSTDRAFGLVGQSFCDALHQELTEYYRLMSVLEAQLKQNDDEVLSDHGSELTVRRLAVWMCGPHIRLKTMAALVDVCQGKKGGALATAIHSYLQHGDPTVRSLIRHMLALVAQPIFSTIITWQYHGELEDTYHEFFVASDPTVKNERLWHEKYTLRKSMIPSFISLEQAKKILLTGKSVNFLRQVCHDRTSIRSRDIIRQTETNQVESIFSQDVNGIFQKMIDAVYKETSRHLLDILHTKYKFVDHLKAMRRYLLLGQGDFIRYLMDLLEDDLAKPPQMLFLHNLTSILETAIRGTNAQYDDIDILRRLDVRLLEVSPGDIGWDVFSLDYHVDGPVQTVFTPESMIIYLRVFNFLWRAKRMEYILAGIWKSQMSNARILKSMPELSVVLHHCHMLASEMVHFVQQVQYYINFEVLECSWDELLNKMNDAEDLDCVIAAHQVFLDTISTRCLLDKQSQGKWGVTETEERKEERRRKDFRHTMLSATKAQLSVLASSYQEIWPPSSSYAINLEQRHKNFNFRLDFNEQYNARDPKLRRSRVPHKTKRRDREEKMKQRSDE
ncbi:hypothetical protein LSH36_555g02025 [Paralvinella palmiformis]|uniref:Gamma-tubulin complex component n=1 Tax=Paralvinella palmiformis TaxID=53620 RepID=A0AAD9J6J2_9ANNE|nr:hypothetical protein LSH36_555g02025 [Paralvinella palmiformis]